jgi:hypothetical protein
MSCLFYWYAKDGTITYRDNFTIPWGSSAQWTHVTLVTVEAWWTFRLYITLGQTNTVHCQMTFTKLA